MKRKEEIGVLGKVNARILLGRKQGIIFAVHAFFKSGRKTNPRDLIKAKKIFDQINL